MIFFDYLYINLYNFYYKDGDCKSSDNPSLRAAHILSFTFLLWIICSIILFRTFVLNKNSIPNIWVWIVLYLLFYIPIYYFYCIKKRYSFLYESYKQLPLQKKKANNYIVISLIIIPLLLLFFICIIPHSS